MNNEELFDELVKIQIEQERHSRIVLAKNLLTIGVACAIIIALLIM